MGYDAWISLGTPRKIKREEFEKIMKEWGKEMPYEAEYSEKYGLETVDETHNPEYNEVHEFAKVVARVAGMPVEIYWHDDEDTFTNIVFPDGTIAYEERIWRTPIGEFKSVEEFWKAWEKEGE